MKKRLSTFCLLFTIVVVSFISFILPGNNITRMISLPFATHLSYIYQQPHQKKNVKKLGKYKVYFMVYLRRVFLWELGF